MTPLSPRAEKMRRAAESAALFPGLPDAERQELWNEDRLVALAQTGLNEEKVAFTPVLREFQIRYGWRSMIVRGDPPARALGLFESWADLGGMTEHTYAVALPDGAALVQCLETVEHSPSALAVHSHTGVVYDPGGTLLLADPGRGPWDHTPIASSFDVWFEWESLLDERYELAPHTLPRPFRRARGEAVAGVARTIAEKLSLAPAVEASCAWCAAWSSAEALVRTRPVLGGGALLDVVASQARMEEILPYLEGAFEETEWPPR